MSCLTPSHNADCSPTSLYRYLRLVVNLFAFSRLRPIPIPEIPRLTSQDVTVVIPSIEGDGEVLWETIRSILATEPFEIILVTIDANLTRAQLMVKHMGTSRVKIRSVTYPNKRPRFIPTLQYSQMTTVSVRQKCCHGCWHRWKMNPMVALAQTRDSDARNARLFGNEFTAT